MKVLNLPNRAPQGIEGFQHLFHVIEIKRELTADETKYESIGCLAEIVGRAARLGQT